MDDPIIKVENLSVIYDKGMPSETKAVEGASVEIYPQEFVIIFGPSGCGKSTLLYAMSGIERNIDATKLSVKGKDLLKISKEDLTLFHRKDMGIVFQAYNLIPTLSLLDNVTLPLVAGGIGKKVREKKASLILSRLEILHLAKRFPQYLSGGQQQRVGIARALVNNPDIVFADEPVGNLDSKSAKVVMDTLLELNQDSKKTIILVSHDPSYLSLAHKIFFMKDGKIIKEERRKPSRQEREQYSQQENGLKKQDIGSLGKQDVVPEQKDAVVKPKKHDGAISQQEIAPKKKDIAPVQQTVVGPKKRDIHIPRLNIRGFLKKVWSKIFRPRKPKIKFKLHDRLKQQDVDFKKQDIGLGRHAEAVVSVSPKKQDSRIYRLDRKEKDKLIKTFDEVERVISKASRPSIKQKFQNIINYLKRVWGRMFKPRKPKIKPKIKPELHDTLKQKDVVIPKKEEHIFDQQDIISPPKQDIALGRQGIGLKKQVVVDIDWADKVFGEPKKKQVEEKKSLLLKGRNKFKLLSSKASKSAKITSVSTRRTELVYITLLGITIIFILGIIYYYGAVGR